MIEKRKIYRQHNPYTTKSDWKNHPLVIASGAAVASFLLATAIFTQLVLPTQTAKLDIELLKLKDEIKNLNDKKEKLNENNNYCKFENEKLITSGNELQSQIKELKAELIEARAGAMFSSSSPYPIGYGLVRIGMSIDDIKKTYPPKKLHFSDNKRVVHIPIENSPCNDIQYYFDNDRQKSISHIGFSLSHSNKDYPDDFIKNKIMETFGPPVESASKTLAKWNVDNKYLIYTDDMKGFVIMKFGEEPLFWSIR